jgi:hypothetical protein
LSIKKHSKNEASHLFLLCPLQLPLNPLPLCRSLNVVTHCPIMYGLFSCCVWYPPLIAYTVFFFVTFNFFRGLGFNWKHTFNSHFLGEKNHTKHWICCKSKPSQYEMLSRLGQKMKSNNALKDLHWMLKG